MYRSIIQSILLSSFLFALRVVALVPRTPFGHMLMPRQGVCDSACSVFQNALTSCSTISCLCTASVANGLQSCVDCSVGASPTADVISTAQQLVGVYLGQCPGFTVTVHSGTGNGGGSGITTSKPVVVVPSTTTTTTTPVVIKTPITTTTTPPASTTVVVVQTPTTSTTPFTFTTVPTTTFGDGAPSISQSTVRPSAVNGPADGTSNNPTSGGGVSSGPSSGAGRRTPNFVAQVVLGFVLSIALTV